MGITAAGKAVASVVQLLNKQSMELAQAADRHRQALRTIAAVRRTLAYLLVPWKYMWLTHQKNFFVCPLGRLYMLPAASLWWPMPK